MVQATQFRGSTSGKVIQTTAELPDIKADEVLVKVTDSGLCGSDLHFMKLPLVLGHEGIGIVEQVGSSCSQLKVGDRVGWGSINSTCDVCDMCMSGRDAYCPSVKMYGVEGYDTQGSMCSHAVRKEQWLFKVPDSISSADAAPLMCGGGTVWAPLVQRCKSYERVGIVGIGGLGHLAIQFAAKMGCDVVVFSSTEDKRDEALKLGANEFYATKGISNYATLGVTKPIDKLLITSSAKYSLGVFYPVLARNASIIPLSVDSGDLTAPYMATVLLGHSIVGSCASSRYPQNKMIDFAARHKISPIVERYPMTLEGVTEAIDRLRSGKIRYRGVLSWD
ncbi:NADP-dependent alcohol dehydrogenase [Aspergillus sclerotioniger CBS 115572]|uniref:NADP-dependent alcohol dehydrogenase n=1 Tax=Aspergillus sclerotioniger CBS 115572 TaxID=1450535 RepID=A0A317WPM4_9EURO|nr:NADP-dependent alcohol dehydrogenase [Aspergillus sclerotioniger CBS 115572]PWY87212.1 NADP-dependent alcohol dehydrogenase [Aspergillus sclerotioniger CBS 115572]